MTTEQTLRLTTLASCAGCAAKLGADALAEILNPLKQHAAPKDLLVGLHAIDDAAVYRVNDQQAIISTADFFPPVVDDPYSFGAIAAANALSDVYAMGGKVLMAINLVAWPDNLDPRILSSVLQGGMDTVEQANSVIAGGHTIIDDEPKYGLAVTGMVHPQQILTKGGAKPGDWLILSKPLGTGLLTTAQKRDLVDAADMDAAIQSMKNLNRLASEALVLAGAGVHAVTDVTGFGIVGHSWEMAAQSLTNMHFHTDALPLLPNVQRYAKAGCIPGGAVRNENHLHTRVRFDERMDAVDRAIYWDPQTSGGLLAAIDPALWPSLSTLENGVKFWKIGEVTEPVTDAEQITLKVS